MLIVSHKRGRSPIGPRAATFLIEASEPIPSTGIYPTSRFPGILQTRETRICRHCGASDDARVATKAATEQIRATTSFHELNHRAEIAAKQTDLSCGSKVSGADHPPCVCPPPPSPPNEGAPPPAPCGVVGVGWCSVGHSPPPTPCGGVGWGGVVRVGGGSLGRQRHGGGNADKRSSWQPHHYLRERACTRACARARA